MSQAPTLVNVPANGGNPTADAYLRTRVLTARPEELRGLLLDGAVKFARQGRDALGRRDFEGACKGISQARDIVLELLVTIRDEANPPLAEQIRALYTFLYSELVTSSFEKDVQRLDKVIELLEYEAETWRLLLQKLAVERAAGGGTPEQSSQPAPSAGAARPANVAPPASSPAHAPRAALSVEA